MSEDKDVWVAVRKSAVTPLREKSNERGTWQNARVSLPYGVAIGGEDVSRATFIKRLWWEGETRRGHERIPSVHEGHDRDGTANGTLVFKVDPDDTVRLRVYDRDEEGRTVWTEGEDGRRQPSTHVLDVPWSEVARTMREGIDAARKADDVCITLPAGTDIKYYDGKTKDGRSYQNAAVTLPEGTRASGRDLSGHTLWIDAARGTGRNGKEYQRIKPGQDGTSYVYVRAFPDLRVTKAGSKERVSVDPAALKGSIRRAGGEVERTPDQVRSATETVLRGQGAQASAPAEDRVQAPLR